LEIFPDKYRNAIILADKPLDKTSTSIVNIFRKNLKLDKVGHAGTLDPKATGLLILCTDAKTKYIEKIMELEKEYSGVFRIGARTKSFDTETEEQDFADTSGISDELIKKSAETLTGEIFQLPPMFSAVKHKGKPLYKLARKGKTIERKLRRVYIKNFEIKKISDTEVWFNVICSKGTYVRTLAEDFGKLLGVGAYLKSLRRTRIGNYALEDSRSAGEKNVIDLNEDVCGIKYKVISD